MIEVKKNRGRFDFCNSCGGTEKLVEVGIRRSRSVNTTVICLCRDCAKEIYWRLIEMEGEEEA
ncbi:MAG: hypothetical protein LUC87_06005 [Clostridiales bacterium]|nr:hypothetical protein [Clostridiales bacterium]